MSDPKIVAFQGEHGAFSEHAIRAMYGDSVTTLPQPDLRSAFVAVERGDAACALVPIENSVGGSIDGTYEELLKGSLMIEAETQIPINQCLLVPKGTQIPDIKRVYSHPQALAQCQEFLRRQADWDMHAVYDTAGAARMVAKDEAGDAAAIAPRMAAELYGLTVLRPNIQDDPSNTTRFIRVGHERAKITGEDKTSLMFVLKDVPGALFKAIACFALRELNLRKLQSRPSKARAWHYAFYLDFEGHVDDPSVQKALGHLEELTSFLKVFGSYPATV